VPAPINVTRHLVRELERVVARSAGIGLLWLTLAVISPEARAQGTTPAAGATLDSTVDAAEGDAVEPRRKLVKWNEYDGPVSTLKFGMNFMTDGSTYVQDDKSKQQIAMSPDVGVRDFRVVFRGRFKTKRPLSWSLGYMYDGADKEWRFRQTGINIGVPELSGQFFIGRQKEGYSIIKVSSGITLWGIERSQTLDAFVPILADGIKYLGYYPRQRLFLNLGAYGDALSEKEKFSTYDRQIITRFGWQPILSEPERKLLHVAVMERDCKPDDGSLREKSKPGAYLAPIFLDTGKFAADHSRTFGLEAAYRSGPWLFTGEYDWQQDHALTGETPVFHGGEASVVWLVTGETRPYNVRGAYFESVSPAKPVFEGGPGALEAVLTFDYSDLDDGSFQGGKFWRVTPMADWHLADYLILKLVYGYGKLDRFGITGTTQFYQTRIQFYF
jgi:phosphate-selective porin OprO/OprP